jgi:hypothetical protein
MIDTAVRYAITLLLFSCASLCQALELETCIYHECNQCVEDTEKFSYPSPEAQIFSVSLNKSDLDYISKSIKEILQSNSTHDYASLILSVIAVIASIGAIYYTHIQDKASRNRSVNDEFWIRQIISPVVIEPFIKEINGLVSELPDDCSSTAGDNQIYQAFLEITHPKFQHLYISMEALKIISDDLFNQSIRELESLEDLVINYCGDNIDEKVDINSQPVNPRSNIEASIKNKLITILEKIKHHQTSNL